MDSKLTKFNIKNIRETYCPLCFNKLKIDIHSTIPVGEFSIINDFVYKENINKTEKSTDYNFRINRNKLINNTMGFTFKKNYPNKRLKLNNKMATKLYLDDKSTIVSYNIWRCINSTCRYYKIIDDIEYDFKAIK